MGKAGSTQEPSGRTGRCRRVALESMAGEDVLGTSGGPRRPASSLSVREGSADGQCAPFASFGEGQVCHRAKDPHRALALESEHGAALRGVSPDSAADEACDFVLSS